MKKTPKFSPENIARHLAVIQKYDPIFLYKSWMKSAEFFQKAAEKKIDITEAIPALHEIYRDSNNIGVMEFVGNALIRHYLNIEDYETIKTLVNKANYISYYLRPIEKYHQKRPLPTEVLKLVISLAKKERFIVEDILVRHIKVSKNNQQESIDEMFDLIKSTFKDRRVLTKMIQRLRSAGVKVKQSLDALVEVLQIKNEKENAAGDLMWATEAGADLSAVTEVLKTFLDDKKINFKISYILSYYYVSNKAFEDLTFLLEHKKLEVKAGGIRGLAVRLCSSKQKDYELIHKLLEALTSKNKEIQQRAFSALQQAKQKKMSTTPNRIDFEMLVDALGKSSTNEVIIPFLVEYMGNKVKLASEVLALVDKPKKLQIRLAEICNSITKDTYSKVCFICKEIPRKKSYWHDMDVPKEVEKLEPKLSPRQASPPILRTCPKCSNVYLYEQYHEYDVNSMDLDIMIERLFTIDLMSKLIGEELKAYKLELPAKLEKYKEDLNHSALYLSQDACYALLIYYLSENNYRAVSNLLEHKNENVVATALAYFRSHRLTKKPLPHADVIASIETCLVNNKNRIAAATLTTAYALLQKKEAKARELINSPVKDLRAGAFDALRALNLSTSINLLPFQNEIIAALKDKDKSVSQNAKYILDKLVETSPKGFDSKKFLLTQFSSKKTEILEDALYSLRTYVKRSKDYEWAIEVAGELLQKKNLTYYSLEVLKLSAKDDKSMMQMLPYLERYLKQHHKDYTNDILYLVYNIYNAGVSVEKLLPEIAILLNVKRKKFRESALSILEKALEKGIDLTFAEQELLDADLGQSDSYDQDITYILTDIYLKAANNQELTRLFSDKNRNRRGAALAYLNRYPKKSELEISGFIQAVISGIGHDHFYIDDNAKEAVAYFKGRSALDKELISSLM